MATIESNAATLLRTERPELDIRPAERDDMSLIADFIRSSADWYRPFVKDEDMSEHDPDEAWEAENFEKREFFVGETEGEPVGTISIQEFGDWAYLGYIYLDADQTGKGFGRTLIEHAEAVARERGLRGLALIAHPEATWATKAYRRYGFEAVARRREEVLRWEGGALRSYYEEGFELYLLEFDADADSAAA